MSREAVWSACIYSTPGVTVPWATQPNAEVTQFRVASNQNDSMRIVALLDDLS